MFTFTHLHEGQTMTAVSMKTDEVSWVNLFERFREFLNGCGYIIPQGDIIVEELECMCCKNKNDTTDMPEEKIEVETRPVIITGPGRYVTRGGDVVDIHHWMNGDGFIEYRGIIGTSTLSWTKFGEWLTFNPSDLDIIGKANIKCETDLE